MGSIHYFDIAVTRGLPFISFRLFFTVLLVSFHHSCMISPKLDRHMRIKLERVRPVHHRLLLQHMPCPVGVVDMIRGIAVSLVFFEPRDSRFAVSGT